MDDPVVGPTVAAFLALGVLPPEDDATEDHLEELGQRLAAIERPVTDEEALAIAGLFGGDNCYGLAWSLLHSIETAPNSATNPYPTGSGNWWIERVIARQEAFHEIQANEGS